jgi:hypothetical protein
VLLVCAFLFDVLMVLHMQIYRLFAVCYSSGVGELYVLANVSNECMWNSCGTVMVYLVWSSCLVRVIDMYFRCFQIIRCFSFSYQMGCM